MAWLSLLFIMRKIWGGKNDYGGLSNWEWMKLSMIPLFTMAALLVVFFGGGVDKRMQSVSIFLAVGLISVC